MFGARNPDLLAVDHIAVVSFAPWPRFSAGVSVPVFGSLTPNACNRREPSAIFGKYRRFCSDSVPQKRTHDVHLRVARRGVSARVVDLFEDDGGFRDEPAPPYSSGISVAIYPACVRA